MCRSSWQSQIWQKIRVLEIGTLPWAGRGNWSRYRNRSAQMPLWTARRAAPPLSASDPYLVFLCLLASSSSSSSSEWFCFSLALSFYHSLLPLQEEIVFYGAFILGWAWSWASRPITNILRVAKLNIKYVESLRLNCPTAPSPYQYPLSEPLTQKLSSAQNRASSNGFHFFTHFNYSFEFPVLPQSNFPNSISAPEHLLHSF